MSENDVKSIALFFFFALLDEGKATEAATEAVENYRRRRQKNPDARSSVAVVAATKQIWQKISKRIVRGRPNYPVDSGWSLPPAVNMGPWKEFQKSAQEDEFLSLLWSQILRISDQDISDGLGVSVGTLRYRVGRALRKLGTLTVAAPGKAQLLAQATETQLKDSQFSKKGQRKISSFIGQELLYDFMTDQLDSERKKAVEEHLRENREAQVETQKIQNGVDYTLQLSKAQVSETLIGKIKRPTTYIQVIIQKSHFEDWPPMMRMGLEASFVALGVTVFALIIPWNRLIDIKWKSSQIILSEVDNQLAKRPQAETEVGAKEQPSFPDEGSGPETAKATTTTLHIVAKAIPPPAEPKQEPVKIAADVAQAEVEATKEAKGNGFLYRGTIAMINPKAVASKIVEKMAALGARKAGNVELGWSKGAGAYYHFTMPQSKYDEMIAIFKEYGQLKIKKEKHERLMPEGIIRVIIDAEEKR